MTKPQGPEAAGPGAGTGAPFARRSRKRTSPPVSTRSTSTSPGRSQDHRTHRKSAGHYGPCHHRWHHPGGLGGGAPIAGHRDERGGCAQRRAGARKWGLGKHDSRTLHQPLSRSRDPARGFGEQPHRRELPGDEPRRDHHRSVRQHRGGQPPWQWVDEQPRRGYRRRRPQHHLGKHGRRRPDRLGVQQPRPGQLHRHGRDGHLESGQYQPGCCRVLGRLQQHDRWSRGGRRQRDLRRAKRHRDQRPRVQRQRGAGEPHRDQPRGYGRHPQRHRRNQPGLRTQGQYHRRHCGE